MRYILAMIFMLSATVCFADVKLYRYTDKATGEECGVKYGDIINNPKWNYHEINDKDKEQYISLMAQQQAAKKADADDKLDKKKKKTANKLKSLGLDKEDIQAILGDNYGD